MTRPRKSESTQAPPRRAQPSSVRLLDTIGPDVVQVTAPGAGVKLLVDRPDLAEVARRKHWPQPLTAMVRQIIAEGLQKQTATGSIDRYLDLCFWLVRDAARVDPPELVEAMAADEAEYEESLAAWQAEVDAARKELAGAKEGSEEAAAARLLIEDLKSPRPAPQGTHAGAVLRELDGANLKRLFVDIEPDEDQLILLPPGDPRRPRVEERTFKFTQGDLFALAPAIMLHQEGGFGMFRQ